MAANTRSRSDSSYDSKWSHKLDNIHKNNDKSSQSSVQTSPAVMCDSDSSSDVNSVNGSCCLNATKCTFPWNSPLANKMEKQKPNELCE